MKVKKLLLKPLILHTILYKNNVFYGLVLLESLLECCRNAEIYVFCLDRPSFELSNNWKGLLSNKKVQYNNSIHFIQRKSFEDIHLKEIRYKLSKAEHAQYSLPLTFLHIFQEYQQESTFYLDARNYFFRDPSYILQNLYGHDSYFLPPSSNSKTLPLYFIFMKASLNGQKMVFNWHNCQNQKDKRSAPYLENEENFSFFNWEELSIPPSKSQFFYWRTSSNGPLLRKKSSKQLLALTSYYFKDVHLTPHKIFYDKENLSGKCKESVYLPYFKHLKSLYQQLVREKAIPAQIPFKEKRPFWSSFQPFDTL